jgi:hypothetical protein
MQVSVLLIMDRSGVIISCRMADEKPSEKRPRSTDMKGVAAPGNPQKPLLGWTSLVISLTSPFIAAAIIAASPHGTFVAAYAELLLLGIISVVGVLTGIIGLRRREQPSCWGSAGVTVGLGIILFCLLFTKGCGCQIENGF